MARRRWTALLAIGAVLGTTVANATPAAPADAATWETVIDGSSFRDRNALMGSWNFRYPWGSDHNGTARMYASATDNSSVFLTPAGTLNLVARRITGNEGNSTAVPHLPIRYHSGAIHAKTQIVVNNQFPQWEVRGEFSAPSTRGTWPAFWLCGAWTWPPESDIMEFKGNATNWFNTFRTASDVSTTTANVSNPGGWHQYRAWINKVNATDVDIHYYLDDVWKGRHRATGFVGKPMWLILNLQMEGSSGSPGPGTDTWLKARNVVVGRSRA